MMLFILAAAAAASSTTHYDCVIDKQFVITDQGGTWNQSQVQFPDTQKADWSFAIDVRSSKDDLIAKVIWPKDLVQIAGDHPALSIAPGQTAFVAASGGPCMFSETACLTMVEVSDVDANSATVSLTPAGSTQDKDSGKRSLLQVISLGRCTRKTGSS